MVATSVNGLVQMEVLGVRQAQTAFPTGNPKFSVKQSFPAAFSEVETDPFLMLDHWGPIVSPGEVKDPDSFPVNWHPHRGIDILTYMISGKGRHADSLGNRETYETPGMQWISVGSGIEHAEGGGTPKGELDEGFQIWVNVPGSKKMDDPRYGTELPESIPLLEKAGVEGRILAGVVENLKGPFKTVQDVQMVDYRLKKNHVYEHILPENYNTCLLYVYKGEAKVNGSKVEKGFVVRLHAESENPAERIAKISAKEDTGCLLFAGVKLNEPIAWHGPFVMNTEDEIRLAIGEYHQRTFLKKRAKWDYKRIAARPQEDVQELDTKLTQCL